MSEDQQQPTRKSTFGQFLNIFLIEVAARPKYRLSLHFWQLLQLIRMACMKEQVRIAIASMLCSSSIPDKSALINNAWLKHAGCWIQSGRH